MRVYRSYAALWVILSGAIPGFAQEPQPAPPTMTEFVVPAGTRLPVVLTTFLNSRSSQVGDAFYGETNYPIWIQQRLVIPRGSLVKGVVSHVQRPGKIKGKGQIAIRFENILLPNGVSRDLTAALSAIHGPGAEKIDRQSETVEMDSSKGRDTAQVMGPAGEGAIIGAIAGRGMGAGIGAGAGGAVGLATVLLTRGRELVLEPGTEFELELKQPLRFAHGELVSGNQPMNSSFRSPVYRRSRQNRDDDRDPAARNRRIFPFPW
ncbi:MAG: hypothetical protein ACREUU_03605 [Gammaproteobacteria bacterium]